VIEAVPENISERIIKLYNMATHEGSNPHEAELAMTRMRKLMAEHDLAMADVEMAALGKTKAKAFEIVTLTAYTRKGLLARYDHAIARAVEVLTTTTCFLGNYREGSARWQSMKFVGTPQDAELACQLFHVFLRSARMYARINYGPKWGVQHSSFVFGFGARLKERAADWKSVVEPARQQQYGLILVGKKDAIDRHLSETANLDHKKKYKSIAMDGSAYVAGQAHANRTDLGVSAKLRK
jgi:hypothetical protein